MQVNPSSPRLRLPLITAKSRLSPSARPKLGGSQQEREDLRRRLARDPTSRDAFAFRPAAAFPSMALDAEIFADMFDEVDRSTCVAGAVCVLNAVALVNAAVATNVV